MSWLDCHLWEFTANERKYSMLVPNDPDWNERFKNAGGTKLSALLTIGVREIGYVYDMGDNWQHRIIVEKLKPAEPGAVYPQFLGGERRCPPEDCGGHPVTTTSPTILPANKTSSAKPLDWYGALRIRYWSVVWRLCLLVTERMSHAWLSSVSTTLTIRLS
jgi:hypothetical protein